METSTKSSTGQTSKLRADCRAFWRLAFNSAKQFVKSPDFDDAVTGAVADNQGAHEKMSDYFFTQAPGRSLLISDIAKWFYQVVVTEHANTQSERQRPAPLYQRAGSNVGAPTRRR